MRSSSSAVLCSSAPSATVFLYPWIAAPGLPGLPAAQSTCPRRIEVIRHARPDHLDAANEVVLDPERLGHMNARCAPGKAAHVGHLAVGQFVPAVLDAIAVLGERVEALAVVLLDAFEVGFAQPDIET